MRPALNGFQLRRCKIKWFGVIWGALAHQVALILGPVYFRGGAKRVPCPSTVVGVSNDKVSPSGVSRKGKSAIKEGHGYHHIVVGVSNDKCYVP